MTRWEPNARGRLEQAALELFAEQGFEGTTVEDIATRAGLTKRTFFRYFGDKREVLFAGGEEFQALFVNGLAAAPASATPMEAIAVTLESVSGWFRDRHDRARRRQRIIVANAELQERELRQARVRRRRPRRRPARARRRGAGCERDRRDGDRGVPERRSSAGSPTTRSGSWPTSSASRSTRCAP